MSHIADVDVLIKDLPSAEATAKHYGGELVYGQTTHKWYNAFLNDWQDPRAAVNRRDPATFGKCAHAIKFPGINYEIGLAQNADGSFTPIYDNYGYDGSRHDGHKLEQLMGVGLKGFVDKYTEISTLRKLARQGWRVTRSVGADGAVELVAVK